MLINIIQILCIIVTAVLASLWILYPSGNYEPWTVLVGVVSACIAIIRQRRNQNKLKSSQSLPTKKEKSKSAELIEWIQNKSFDLPLSQVLPRALKLAQLIGDKDFEHWVRMELYGYSKEGGMKEGDVVPEYRIVTGRHYDHYNRMLQITEPKLDIINTDRLRYGIRMLEELSQKTEMLNTRDEGKIAKLKEYFNFDVYSFRFNPLDCINILDSIRNRLIEKVNQIEIQC